MLDFMLSHAKPTVDVARMPKSNVDHRGPTCGETEVQLRRPMCKGAVLAVLAEVALTEKLAELCLGSVLVSKRGTRQGKQPVLPTDGLLLLLL